MESLEKVSVPENQVVDPTLAPEAPSVAPVESETLEETSATQEEPVRMDDVMNRLRELAA